LLVRGISTRNYDAALTSLSDGLGLKRSAVSSAFQRASQKDLDALNGRPLGEWTFVAVYIDGVGFADKYDASGRLPIGRWVGCGGRSSVGVRWRAVASAGVQVRVLRVTCT
ncbi:MAG: hypothetical protein GY725_19935, partial [bacterium]|nr:hypothetical protein [bacterium]